MTDIDYIPLSYLSQYYYCPRRASLLMLEQVWEENKYTASGRAEHERVHDARFEKRGPLIKLYEYSVFSKKLSLAGKCDCIEAVKSDNGCILPFSKGFYTLYPIEYKHGVVRNEFEYQIQLCAQAMCLEEMYGCKIKKGSLFFIDAHRRNEILLSNELRSQVTTGAKALLKIMETQKIPCADYSAKCKKCSLLNYCQPKIEVSASSYCKRLRLIACDMEAE